MEKKSSHRYCVAQTLLISSQSHTSRLTFLLFLRNSNQHQIEPTEQRNIYMTQEAIKTKKNKQIWNWMIVSRVESKSIWNTNETEDSKKNRNERCKTMEQHPNMLDMMKINFKKWKQQKETKFKSWRKADSFTTT